MYETYFFYISSVEPFTKMDKENHVIQEKNQIRFILILFGPNYSIKYVQNYGAIPFGDLIHCMRM